jgi:acetylglutamate kinase
MSRLVVKCGGAVAAGAAAEVLALADAGCEICVVHGAGPQITAEMARRGIPVEFVHGRRVTSLEGLAVVRDALAEVNHALVEALAPRAIGFMGDDLGLPATRVQELGYVGNARPSRPAPIEAALAEGLIPVVAPLGAGPLNVNADEAAAALAVGLGADRLMFVSDVPGVFVEGEVANEIEAEEAHRLVDDGTFQGGIVPKLQAAIHAARLGVRAEIGQTAVLP